ncbi:hypothetical protein CEXT_326861 [Caerostris extrusa]|uniref:Uncharacterized protein n=1 Tax=Caerostris extrusa TaxID=172846 RepID=A0AAV4T160_CAEEX|nr:hypothetical protein CEXT_326861 [Caerostris extrusa]
MFFSVSAVAEIEIEKNSTMKHRGFPELGIDEIRSSGWLDGRKEIAFLAPLLFSVFLFSWCLHFTIPCLTSLECRSGV